MRSSPLPGTDVLYIPPNALLIRRIFNQASELGAIPWPMWEANTVTTSAFGWFCPLLWQFTHINTEEDPLSVSGAQVSVLLSLL